MTLRQGQYGQFWSCGKKNDDGSWCKYKPNPKQYQGTPVAPNAPRMPLEASQTRSSGDTKELLLREVLNELRAIKRLLQTKDSDILDIHE